MAHMQYMPGDPRLVDQLVCELKSKGIFDQFRKDCIADVDTRPAYQNLRQRVESSVCAFLSRQCWKPDLNKNQLREKLRKHILDGNYLEQGVERIVDQVVNPKVTSVFIPQVEDLVYNYLGITRKKVPKPEETHNNETTEDLLPTDLEAVSPGSVKSNEEKLEVDNKVEDMEIDSEEKADITEKVEVENNEMIEVSSDSASMDKSSIPLPSKEINLNDIPPPDNSPEAPKVQLENIELPREPNLSTDIPLPEEVTKANSDYFKPMVLNSEDSNSSSSSSIRRNMSPLTPVRNFDDENSCDAQQAFENDSDEKANNDEPNTFQFNVDMKDARSNDLNSVKNDKKEEQNLSYQFTNQVNINALNTPLYDDSSNSHNLQIDYESDASKTNHEVKLEVEKENAEDKKDKRDDKKSHKSSHRSRDSSRHSSSKDGRHSSSRDHSRHDKKSSTSHKDDKSKSNKERDKPKETSEKKDKDSSHRSSHKSSSKDKSHKSSSSSHRHSSKSSDEKKSSHKDNSSEKDKDRSSDKSSRDRKDSKSSHRDKDRKSSSSSSKKDEKDKKKDKKDTDDHYSSSGRGNHSRRSTDRDSNDGSSSSKGSHNQNNSKSADSKKESKGSSSKSETTSTSGESTSPSDKEHVNDKVMQFKPIVRVDNHLEVPIANPPRLPFVPDVTLKKPKFAANFEEAKKMMKMRRFLAEEQKRMNQEAALLLEFQANVRPSLSQVYSSIPGPELEFACITHTDDVKTQKNETEVLKVEEKTNDSEVMDVCKEKTLEIKNVVKNYDGLEQNLARIVVPEDKELKIILEKYVEVKGHKKDTLEMTNEVPSLDLISEVQKEEPKQTLELSNDLQVPKQMTLEMPNDLQVPKQMTLKMINEVIGVVVKEDDEPKTEIVESVIVEDIPMINDVEAKVEVKDSEEKKQCVNLVDEIGEFIKATDKSTDSIVLYMVEDEMSKIHAESETDIPIDNKSTEISKELIPKIENELQYFAEHEKFNAELERHKFSLFMKEYVEKSKESNRIYLINCDTYEENILKEVASNFGNFEIVNYYKNGHLHTKNIVKDVSLASEVSLPIESNSNFIRSPLFSPVKSECSFELSSDYDAKLNEIVNKKSRQEVMEIILGGVIDEASTKMPTIDYYMDDTETKINVTGSEVSEETRVSEEITAETRVSDEIEGILDEEVTDSLKRKVDLTANKLSVLTPNKIRKLSDSDQISSTTEETEEVSNNNKVPPATRSKYLGRAKRVGLSRPKRCALPNSPSSDKSVENYVQNTQNGKIRTLRSKVQRYDTSDLYKPKLHYLSRRNMS